MTELLANILTVTYLARDIHYRWKGTDFFAMHLFAERLMDFGTASDDLKECYFLGFMIEEPPAETLIADMAKEQYNEIVGLTPCPLRRAVEALTRTICLVESEKRTEGLPGGVHAILDGISQHALTMRGLLCQMKTEKE